MSIQETNDTLMSGNDINYASETHNFMAIRATGIYSTNKSLIKNLMATYQFKAHSLPYND